MSDTGRRGRNMIWEYFDKVDDENKEAECKICHNLYNYKTTSHNLKNHLRHKHNDIFMNMPASESVLGTPANVVKVRKNRSSVWEYYEVLDNDRKVASCNDCRRTISYKTTTANLKTHLRRVHKELYVEMEGDQPGQAVYLEDEGDDSEQEQDDVWSFFERAGSEARCAVCRACVPVAELRSHLATNHPKLVDVESEEETANNGQEDVYTEVVYLEREDSPKRTPKPIEKRRKSKNKIEKTTIKRRVSSSSDEQPLHYKKTKNNDEIEHFGNYITCLLKKIPTETCMELQMEIVNLIMKKQLELKRKEAAVFAPTSNMVDAQTSVLAGNDAKMAVQTVESGCKTANYEIKISDEKCLSNGYAYSIAKIVTENGVQSNE